MKFHPESNAAVYDLKESLVFEVISQKPSLWQIQVPFQSCQKSPPHNYLNETIDISHYYISIRYIISVHNANF